MSSRIVGLLPTFFYYLVVIVFISGCSGPIQSPQAADSLPGNKLPIDGIQNNSTRAQSPPQPPNPGTFSSDSTTETTSPSPQPRVIRNDVTTATENLDAQKKALDIIADFADRICTKIPLEGDEHKLELTGDAKAEVNKLLKRVANLGIEGALKYTEEEWHGVVRQDLAGQLNDSRKCKLELYKDLKSRMLGKPQTSIDEDKRILAFEMEDLFTELSELLKSGVDLHNETTSIFEDHNRLLKKVRVLFPTDQELEDFIYTRPDAQIAKSLARVMEQLRAAIEKEVPAPQTSSPYDPLPGNAVVVVPESTPSPPQPKPGIPIPSVMYGHRF